MDAEKKYRISFLSGSILIFIAFVFDLPQIILTIIEIVGAPTVVLTVGGLFIDYAVSTIAFITFYLVFMWLGLKFRDKTSLASMGITAVLKLIPLIQGIPMFTIEMILLWWIIRGEDVLKNVTGIDVEKLATDAIGTIPGGKTAVNVATGSPQSPNVTAGITGTVGKSVGEMVQ